ncbi:MAG: thioredoxin-dependent thiol peroxidase [Acidobacteria bacterium]|nr:thioredoxin-dependent thiol peroxidase [Acidobacteriota bacterium]
MPAKKAAPAKAAKPAKAPKATKAAKPAATTAKESTLLNVGAKAPAFSLKNTEGKTVKLSDLKGKKVVLYFYPKDMTPGCTVEACGFRDDYAQLKKRGVEVIGVSGDDQKSHQKFTEKYSLPFTLLSDPTHEMMEKYGAWGEKSLYGRKYMGVLRITYIIDEEGRITHVFDKVKTATHSKDIIAAL